MSAKTLWPVTALLVWIAAAVAAAGEVGSGEPARPYAVTEDRGPCDAYDPLRQPFFGDTHVHTAYSFDASAQDTRDTPRDAYRFGLWAIQDPGSDGSPGTPLRRIQIVKGWIEQGEPRERVIDVASSGSDASVDLATCERRGAGATSLCSVWTDPDFDPAVPAFYCGRVLENPSCRWSQYVCIAAGVDCDDTDSVPEGLRGCCSEDHQPVIQERAWTSPIWYTP